MNPSLESVQIHDAGEVIVLAGTEEAAVNSVIEALEREGAGGIQRPVKVGSRWFASFSTPPDAELA
jgi:hypothetical protein